jgi:hypothetical protein
MSRSYHVTEKKALAAFLQGDEEPSYMASEKSWIKRKQKEARSPQSLGNKSLSNRAIVAEEKKRTKHVRSARECRKGPG